MDTITTYPVQEYWQRQLQLAFERKVREVQSMEELQALIKEYDFPTSDLDKPPRTADAGELAADQPTLSDQEYAVQCLEALSRLVRATDYVQRFLPTRERLPAAGPSDEELVAAFALAIRAVKEKMT